MGAAAMDCSRPGRERGREINASTEPDLVEQGV